MSETNFNCVKKFTYFLSILTIIFYNINQVKSESELAENLKLEINNISESFPEKWENFFQSINSNGSIKIDKCDISIAPHRFNVVHKFSSEVTDYFQDIIFAKSTVFKTFNFNVKKANSDYTELIGAARVINNQIEFAYIETITKSITVPRFNIQNYEHCIKVLLFIPICKQFHIKVNEPFTEEDILLIYQTLRAHSYTHISRTTEKVLTALEDKQFVLSQNSEYFSNNDKFYLNVQSDGNLVLYKKDENIGKINEKRDEAIWTSNTFNKGNEPYMLAIEEDGTLAIYDNNWTMLWMADFDKNENLPYNLVVSDEGQMQLNDNKGNLMWKNGDKVKIKVQSNGYLKFLE